MRVAGELQNSNGTGPTSPAFRSYKLEPIRQAVR